MTQFQKIKNQIYLIPDRKVLEKIKNCGVKFWILQAQADKYLY